MHVIEIKETDGSTTEYVRDKNNVIKQLYPQRFVYDAKYCATYDSPDYERKSAALQALRLGYVQACALSEVYTLLDCGYGNGAFLKYAENTRSIGALKGYDVSGLPVPKGCSRINALPLLPESGYADKVDVITFWDCLEHFPDLTFLRDLNAGMVVVSLPWCHYNLYAFQESQARVANGWFASWHHRKPNEHLHHFDRQSLIDTFREFGWQCLNTNNMEDVVRKGKNPRLQNILTAAFVRK